MHMLAPMAGSARLAGCTVGDGFILLGSVRTELVEVATAHALRSLPANPSLAVHPRCGTNIAVAGLLAGGLLSLAELPRSRGFRAWVLRIAALCMAALLARPAGLWAQRHITTSGQVEGMRIAAIQPLRWGHWTLHHVVTHYDG